MKCDNKKRMKRYLKGNQVSSENFIKNTIQNSKFKIKNYVIL